MTNREFYTAITAENATITAEMVEHAQAQLAKLDETLAKRKGKVSKADQEKRDANAALATKVATEILTAEAKTATDVAAVMNEQGWFEDEVKVQKASYLCRLAVEMGLATQTDVKIPKKGSQKAYTTVEVEAE